jgi:hypothetical protein
MSALLFNTIRINCTPQKFQVLTSCRGKKLVLKCVARRPFAGNTLLVSAKSVFCQWVKNGWHMVHRGPERSRTSGMTQKMLGNVDFVAKDFERGEMECPPF